VTRPPKALQDAVHRRVRAIFETPDVETARLLLDKFSVDFAQHAPAAVATLERGFEDAPAVLALPEPYSKRLRTTNVVEMA
jgi:putative transposase